MFCVKRIKLFVSLSPVRGIHEDTEEDVRRTEEDAAGKGTWFVDVEGSRAHAEEKDVARD